METTTADTSSDPCAVLGRLIDAIQAGDFEAAGACYHPDVVVWHNHDRQTQARAENLDTLRQFVGATSERRYTQVRRRRIDGGAEGEGVVQQHVLVATLHSGRVIELAACLICDVADGVITRLDEYLDPAAMRPRAAVA
jgi:ketosteroid isomerase-like protein